MSEERSRAAALDEAAALERRAVEQNGLLRFFERERRRAARRVGLPVALVGTGSLGYLFSRGTAAFARVPLRTALFAAEVVVFADFLELGLFGVFLAIRSAVAAFGAFHWGALEPLRRGVRAEALRGDAVAAERLTASYLRLSIDLAIFLLAVLVAWLEFGPKPFDAFSIFDAFVIGCGVRAMTETVTRTYHAGAFALRRVRRPFATLFAVDLVDAGVPLLLWPWLGPWGFGVGQLAGALVEAVLTVHYARRTYQELPVRAPTLRRVLSEERSKGSLALLRESAWPGIGNLVSQVDALLIAALAFGTSPEGLALAAGFHVLRPVLAVSGGWARIFYFDLAGLQGPLRTLFRKRFERSLFRGAPWFALSATAGAVLVVAAFAWSAPLPDWLALAPLAWFVPFLLARSVYAVAQVRAFVNGAYAALAAGAGAVVLSMTLISRAAPDGGAALGIAAAGLLLAAILFGSNAGVRSSDGQATTGEKLADPLEFLRRLSRLERPVAVLVLTLNRRAGARAPRVAAALGELREVAFLARWGRRRLLVASSQGRELVPRFVAETAGSVLEVEVLTGENGPAAIARLLASGQLGWSDELEPAPPRDELVARFRAEFPGGTILDERGGAVPRGTASPLELARTLGEVAALAAGVRPARRRGLRAAVYAPGGEAALVFLAARDADPARFAEFEQRAFRASAAATASVSSDR